MSNQNRAKINDIFGETLKKIFPESLKQLILRQIIKTKTQNVIFGKGVTVNRKTEFEGYNSINNHSELTGSFLGRGSYIANNSTIRNTKIGRFCAIGDYVRTGLGKHPTKDFVSIHPAFFSMEKPAGFTFVKKQIFEEHDYADNDKQYYVVIGNDVWIGNNVLIMDGVSIGDGAIIAAGTIITKDVDPYTIVGGVPAKPIRKRFTDEQIDKLLKIKWWDWSLNKLSETFKEFDKIEFFLKS